MAYLLDANVFIESKNRHYGFDFCPAFWEWLVAQNKHGVVYSVEKVGEELEAGTDLLATWASDQGAEFFKRPDAALPRALASVAAWVMTQNYAPAAVQAFLGGADYYLIAHALAHGESVVTHEVAAASVKKIKIPNVCAGLKVASVNPFEMLRREGARFVLGPKGAQRLALRRLGCRASLTLP